MIKAKVNSNNTYQIEYDDSSERYSVNGIATDIDILKLKNNVYHVLKNYQSYNVEIINTDLASKTFTIKINSQIHTVEIKDRYDELLHQLGFDKLHIKKLNDIKAPMPGLVKDIFVSDGQQIKAGDSVAILEAMKMENVLKCPADATVKSVKVKKGSTVEKNEIIIILA
jgi:biotin carboxyl carrier protein